MKLHKIFEKVCTENILCCQVFKQPFNLRSCYNFFLVMVN